MIGQLNGMFDNHAFRQFRRAAMSAMEPGRYQDLPQGKAVGHHRHDKFADNAGMLGSISSSGLTQIQYTSFKAEIHKTDEGGFSFSMSIVNAMMVVGDNGSQSMQVTRGSFAYLEASTSSIQVPELVDEVAEEVPDLVVEATDDGDDALYETQKEAAYGFATEAEAALEILEDMAEQREEEQSEGYLI